jgi:aminoglycoside/choline kinase family phosphotransferase
LRKYTGDTAILVHAPVDIPGHGLDDFMHLSQVLRDMRLSAPEIYAFDAAHKLMLTEDFGDTPIDMEGVEREAYETAVDALAVMRGHSVPLVKYKDGYIYKKLSLFSDDPAWLAAWDQIESALPPCPLVFSHMDYKAGNLHWLPMRDGVRRVGLLDFQAAQTAPFTYDIVNLLEDARRTLDADLKATLKARFQDALPAGWKPIFNDWYAVMAAQFHARVLGQIRGNSRVSPDVPLRLEMYLKDALKNPVLRPLQPFFG